jgi:hypothetical protein
MGYYYLRKSGSIYRCRRNATLRKRRPLALFERRIAYFSALLCIALSSLSLRRISMFSLLLGSWRSRKTSSRRHGVARRLGLELLEDRKVLSTFTVTNQADSGPGSLRQAVIAANTMPGEDTIEFARSVHTIKLTSGELAITDDVNIQGRGALRLTVSGNHNSRVFNIQSGEASISGMTIANGRADEDAPDLPSTGGGILNQGSLTLSEVVLLNNRAVGDGETVVELAPPIYLLAGAGLGGGVSNLGTLTVDDSAFVGNQALGADDTIADLGVFPGGPAFSGLALGGAIHNFAVAEIDDTLFISNEAKAGDRGQGDFAAIGGGGAIYNDNDLSVDDSSFLLNRAVGGDESVSPLHNGHAIGGAIASGSILAIAAAGNATLEVNDSAFGFNQAIGGDNNQAVAPIDIQPVDGPNNGVGGAILVYQGSATINETAVEHNQAIGGEGGGNQNGSLGVGGGVFFLNFVGGVTASVSDSTIRHNVALGGDGVNSGDGGDAYGGGLAAGALGGAFGSAGTVTVHNTLIDHNLAQGGQGGKQGGNGGDALGGGIFNDAATTMTVTASRITHNKAQGGKGRRSGDDGEGIGGGVYNRFVFTADASTVIARNKASTSHDNIFTV